MLKLLSSFLAALFVLLNLKIINGAQMLKQDDILTRPKNQKTKEKLVLGIIFNCWVQIALEYDFSHMLGECLPKGAKPAIAWCESILYKLYTTMKKHKKILCFCTFHP